jgi:hypothetical protein
MEEKNCRSCKWAKDINSSYCFCRKKALEKVQISKMLNCNKYVVNGVFISDDKTKIQQ